MDISIPDRPLRRTAWGAFEGAALGALVYFLALRVASSEAEFSIRVAVTFIIAGMIVCAVGQFLARGIIGACAGIVGGLLIGSGFSDEFSGPTLAKHHLDQKAILSGITLQGTRFEIESRRGKVVLVDFWATWCAPCRKELPRVKKLYERYHEEGLDIVGVSLDDSRDQLAKFVEKEKMPWPQIYSDTPGQQGWENPILFRYTIRAIPYTLVVDREGTIVASGLVGSALEDAIAKVMAGEKPARPTMLGTDNPITIYFIAFGWLAGMLVERRLRQVGWRRKPEVVP